MKSVDWKRWEVALAVGLAVGTVGLEVHGRSQRRQLRQAESAPLHAAMAAYRVEYGSLVRYGQQAPDFTARDAKGRPYHLANLLRGARFGVLAFLGGRPERAAGLAWDLEDMRRRYGPLGLRAAAVLEGPQASLLPAWLVPRLRYPLLLDPAGRVARAYGIGVAPAAVLIDASGRIAATDSEIDPIAGDTYLRQEVELRFTGRVRLPRYDPLIRVGGRVPDFLALTSRGSVFRGQDLRGRWSLLVLTMGSCSACDGLAGKIRPGIETVRRRGGRTVWANLHAPAPSDAGDVNLLDPVSSLGRLAEGQKMPCVYLLDPGGYVRAAALPPIDAGDEKLQRLVRLVPVTKAPTEPPTKGGPMG